MGAIISFVSLLILLLSIGIYSLPIEQLDNGLTITDYQFTTVSTVLDHEDQIHIELTSNPESTEILNNDKQKSFDKIDDNESTTPDQFEYPEDVSFPSSTLDDLLFTSSSVIFVSETTLPNTTNDEHSLSDNLFVTIKSDTQVDDSMITSDVNQNQVELSTILKDDSFQNDNHLEQTTNVESLIVESETNTPEESSLIKIESETSSVIKTESDFSSTVQYESNTSDGTSFVETELKISSTTDSESDGTSALQSESNTLIESSSIDIESDGSSSAETESQTSELSSLADDSLDNSTVSNDNDQSEEKPTKSDNDKNTQSSEEAEVLVVSDSTEPNQVDSSIEEETSNN